jgi:hypothetical protein
LSRHREYVLKLVEAGDETTREFDDEAAEERRAQGSTVAALNAFSAGVASEVRADLGFVDPDEAIKTLAAAIDQDTLRVPRLLVLDSLVRFASRRGDEFRARKAEIDPLLEALVSKSQVPETDVGDAVDTVNRALESVAGLSGEEAPAGVDEAPSAHPWEVFVQQAAGSLQLTQAEIEKPLCNDREDVYKGPYKAIGVTVEFHTDASPGELRGFCDPRRWHECSAYQKEMTRWTGAGAIPDQDRPPGGWRRDLLEKVQLAGKDLETPLRFTYTIQDQNDPSWVHLDYVMIGRTGEIDVDEGALDVRRVTSGKHSGRTRVIAKKAILFTDPLLVKWPTVACDTFWMDLVIDAAVGCLGRRATIDSTRGIATMAESKEARLDKAIDEAAAAAQKSIDAYRQLAKRGAAQLAGDSPGDTDTWVELTAKTWAQAARDGAQAWTRYNALLQACAEPAESKTEQTEPGKTDNDA